MDDPFGGYAVRMPSFVFLIRMLERRSSDAYLAVSLDFFGGLSLDFEVDGSEAVGSSRVEDLR